MSKSQDLKQYIASLPQEPGVYRYYDSTDKLIYVGKAKKLKNRVSNYFQDSKNLNYKTKALVRQIHRIEYTIVNSEFDAFLLENSLIKENTPKYNIQLKDDKSFPYICITKEAFPKIIGTRRFREIEGDYYGPFSNVKAMNTVIDSLKKLYSIRSCSLPLSEKTIEKKNYKLCLEYHIGNCLAPCEGKQTMIDYQEKIHEIKKILKGNVHESVQYFQEKIKLYSEQLEFEKAHFYKIKLDYLSKFQNKSIIAGTKDINLHALSITESETTAYINHLEIVNGSIISSTNSKVKKVLFESAEEILTHIIIKEIPVQTSKLEIISNIELSIETPFTFSVPKIGDKKKIIDLALKNALQYKLDQNPKVKESSNTRVLNQLKSDLSLTDLPIHIECFDNSNIQGTNPVASMVCFKNGKPSKKDYRHFKIKTVEGPNDFDSMYEIVSRRYSRLINENSPLPNLIVIDGGKGQLGLAQKALIDLGIKDKIPMIGTAERLEEVYTPGDTHPIYTNKKAESLKLIQQLRNEAHRFAITFHRNLRSKSSITNELNNIKGIGEHTITQLLKKYKSNKNIYELPFEELKQEIGIQKATLIKEYVNKKRDSN